MLRTKFRRKGRPRQRLRLNVRLTRRRSTMPVILESKSRERRRMSPWKLFLSLLILAGLGFAVKWFRVEMFDGAGFKVVKVSVKAPGSISRREIFDRAGIQPGANILSVDLPALVRRMSEDSRVLAVTVQRNPFSGTVSLTLTAREPVALVEYEGTHGISADGWILPESWSRISGSLPLITGVSGGVLDGKRVADGSPLAQALEAAKAIRAANFEDVSKVSEINVAGKRNVALALEGEGTRIELGTPPYRRKLERAKAVLGDLNRRGEVAKTIDLRFGRQIVVVPRSG